MRILISNSYLGEQGGAETYLKSVALELIYHGHAVALFVENSSESEWAKAAEVPVFTKVKQVEDWQPEILFNQGLDNPDTEALLLELSPAVYFAHNYSSTCISGQKFHQRPEVTPCHYKFSPACLANYLPRKCGGNNPLRMMKLYLQASKRQALLNDYKAVVTASRYMAFEMKKHLLVPDKVTVNPIPPSTPLLEEPDFDRALTGNVLFIARQVHNKGGFLIPKAITAASRRLNRDVKLLIAGEGPDLARLQEQAQKLRVPYEWAGVVTGKAKLALYQRADLVVMPSLWPEPYGLVGLEAACFSVPTVAFDSGGISEWLEDGKTGTLIYEMTSKSLGRAISTILSNTKTLATLRRNCYEQVKEFKFAEHVKILISCFESIVTKKKA